MISQKAPIISSFVSRFSIARFSKLVNIRCWAASHRLYASLSFLSSVNLSFSVIARSIIIGAEKFLRRDTVGFLLIPSNVIVSLDLLSSNTFVSIKSFPCSSRRPIDIGITIGSKIASLSLVGNCSKSRLSAFLLYRSFTFTLGVPDCEYQSLN